MAGFSKSAKNFYSSLSLLLALLSGLRQTSFLPRSRRALGLQVALLGHRHPLLLTLALVDVSYVRCDKSLMSANAFLTFLSFSSFTLLIEAFYGPCPLVSSTEDLQTSQAFCILLPIHRRFLTLV